MPTPFENFLISTTELITAVQAAETARKTDKYIKAQVYVYISQVEAAGHYEAAANYRAIRDAAFAGCVAVCTMYVGGLIMGAVYRGAAAGTAAAETAAASAAAAEGAAAESNVLVQLIRASWQASGYQASVSTATFLETVAMELAVGVPVRGMTALLGTMVTDWHNGRVHWSDVPKIGLSSLGGLTRTGPALAFLLGAVASAKERQAREEFERQITTEASRRLVDASINAYASTLGQSLGNFGRYGKMIMAPPLDIDSRVRQPMQREADRVTDLFVKEQTGLFGGPNRDEVFARVYGSVGAEVWAPIASDTTRAYIHLQQQRNRKMTAMNQAFSAWVRSL